MALGAISAAIIIMAGIDMGVCMGGKSRGERGWDRVEGVDKLCQ